MSDLTPAQHGVVLAILAARHAAPELAPIVELCGSEPVEALVAIGIIVTWQAPGGVRVTFTPAGSEGLELAERVEHAKDERVVNGEAQQRSTPSEEPYWVTAGTPWGVKLGEDRYGVVQPPEPGKWVRLERPELVEDKRPSTAPEYLLDEVSEQPIELFRGPEGMAPGVKVKIDPKLAKGKPRRRGPKRAG